MQDVTPYGIDMSYEADKSSEGKLDLGRPIVTGQSLIQPGLRRRRSAHHHDSSIPRYGQERRQEDSDVQEDERLCDSLCAPYIWSSQVCCATSLSCDRLFDPDVPLLATIRTATLSCPTRSSKRPSPVSRLLSKTGLLKPSPTRLSKSPSS